MLKIKALAIGLVAGIFAVSAANAKVCFLPGFFSGEECDTEVKVKCPVTNRSTSPCKSGYDQTTCTDGNRTYYYCTCRNDNIPASQIGSGRKYLCNKSYDSSCGCGASDVVCNTSVYPYTSCADYENSVPGDSCSSGGKTYYKECNCDSSYYAYDCDQRGLKAPVSGGEACKNSLGEEKWSFCLCDDAWSSSECSSHDDGCTVQTDQVYNGNDYCYLCGAETCPGTGQLNLENYWCSLTHSTSTDCRSLGYTKTTTGLCANGKPGLKCPFDSTYIYCQK